MNQNVLNIYDEEILSPVDIYVQRVINYFSGKEYIEELQKAKLTFFGKTGNVFEDSEYYLGRMMLFLDWFIFDYSLNNFNIPPLNAFFVLNQSIFSAEEVLIYRNLMKSIHSIFELRKINNRKIEVVDLISKKQLKIEHTGLSFGENDIFEARILPFKDKLYFSKSFCYHPTLVKQYIQKERKRLKTKSEQEKFILLLANKQLKSKLYQHIDVKKIYSQNSII